jgi:purine nucleoside permease
VPYGRATPFQPPAPKPGTDDWIQTYGLNAGLTDWAYGLTAGITLLDNDRLKANRPNMPTIPTR